MAELIVTNYNRNFTGVSATAANVIRHQVDQYDLAFNGVPLPGCPQPISLKQARRLSREKTPDGRPIIWHVRRNSEMRAALWTRDFLRYPIKIVFTSAAIRRHSAFPRWLISKMDAVVATTQAAAEFVPNVRAVVPHGVDTETFFPAEDRAAAWKATGFPGTQGIATVGRIRPEKGSDRFVATMIELLPKNPKTVALLLGKASKSHQSFLASLKSKVSAAGLSDRILFPGEIHPEQLPKLMRGLSAVVQLPRYEGYGMAPLEGMASGVPFVATNQGYYSQFSNHGEAGIITPEDDIPFTVSSLHSLLNTPAQLERMAQAGRAQATGPFSIKSEVAGINTVYQELWGEKTPHTVKA